MIFHLRARFDGRVLIPEQPVDLPLNQTLEVEVSSSGPNGAINGATNGAMGGESAPSSELILERLRRLDSLNALIPGPVIPLEALRRENLYDDGT